MGGVRVVLLACLALAVGLLLAVHAMFANYPSLVERTFTGEAFEVKVAYPGKVKAGEMITVRLYVKSRGGYEISAVAIKVYSHGVPGVVVGGGDVIYENSTRFSQPVEECLAVYRFRVPEVAGVVGLAVMVTSVKPGEPMVVYFAEPVVVNIEVEGVSVGAGSLPLKPAAPMQLQESEVLAYVKSNVEVAVSIVDGVARIVFINKGDKTVELTDPPWAVFKLTEKGWVKVYEPKPREKMVLQYDPKRGGYVEVRVHELVEIDPHAEVSWEWNMTAYGERVGPGEYAVALRDDITIVADGESLRLVREKGLFRDFLGEPAVCFTIE